MEPFVYLPSGTQDYCVIVGLEGTQDLPQFVGLFKFAVTDILKAGMEGGVQGLEMVPVGSIAVFNAIEVEIVVKGQLLVHRGIEQGGIAKSEVDVVVEHGYQVAAQCGDPGRIGKQEGLKYVNSTVYLARQ